jgi:hypothetical protein
MLTKNLNKENYKLVSLSNVYDYSFEGSTYSAVVPLTAMVLNPTNLFGYTKYLTEPEPEPEPGQL